MGASEFKLEFLKSLSSLIIAAFGLVAALAWNEAIKKAVSMVFNSGNGELISLLIYALLVTVLAVVATMLITRATNKQRKKIEEEAAKKADKATPEDKKE